MARITDPSRDLLFGLLALQTGLINQAQLVAAFHAWTQARDCSMAAILAEQGALEAPCLTLVEGLVIAHLRRHGSDPERSLAALGVGRSTRACLAQLGNPELDASLAQVSSGSTEHDGEDPERTATYSVGTATSEGLRFRILRPHAQGGLGAVFVALDAELHREVALKQLLDHHADDPLSRQRFLLEAEITGGLEHPGVVPVYGLGSYGDGRPYYAMRLIQGDSLKQAIERFHAEESLRNDPGRCALELRKLLRRFTDVCNAIAYAHSRGVLHRDLKPGNVIVGKYGETLVVDWGLAKSVGRSDPGAVPGERTLVPSSSSSLAATLPGSALGTPAYMSPEQAAGALDRLGPRSDVYSLGATLYCLLTGRPPFLGEDVGMILRQVQQGEFPAPRTLDPALDRALEAVCLQAMALKPEDRYASPRALADDLERWMADEPVTAWREPWARRLRRWGRRNRTVVMTATAAVLVALVGTAAVLAVQTRANRQLNEANLDLKVSNAALAAANAQVRQANADLTVANQRVAARFELALEAIQLFHGEVSEDLLLKERQFDELRTKLLGGAAEFYRKLEGLLKPQADQPSRAALGRAYQALGEVTDQIGSKPAALVIHRQALAVRRALAAEREADATITGEVARSLLKVADLQKATGDTSGARSSYQESLTICEALAQAHPAVTDFRLNLAKSHNQMGLLLSETGQPAEALEAFGKAQAINAALARAHPGVADFRRNLAHNYHNIGLVLSETGQPDAALEAYGQARAICEALVRDNPAVTQFQRDLALRLNNIGNLLSQTGKPAEALASYEQARAIEQRLADANPAVTQFQLDLARSHNNIGSLLSETGKLAEALASYEQARAIQQKLADANPAVTQFQSALAGSHNNLGILLEQTGKSGEALASFQAARVIWQKLADANPAVTEFQQGLANGHNNIAIQLKETEKPVEALASYEQARAIRQKLADAHPAVTQFQSALAESHGNIGILLKQTGNPAEALASLEAARAIVQTLADANPNSTRFQIVLANTLLETGDVLRLTGQPAAARASYETALAIIARLIQAQPAFADHLQVYLVFGLKGLGATQQTAGQAADAVASWRRAIASDERTRSSYGETLYSLAGCHAQLGGIAGTAGSGLSAAEGAAELDQAMGVLRRAVAGGYRNATWMHRDPDLDPLRARPDFRLLLMDLAMPADAFARAP
jgi:serine/threonine-protein kinase